MPFDFQALDFMAALLRYRNAARAEAEWRAASLGLEEEAEIAMRRDKGDDGQREEKGNAQPTASRRDKKKRTQALELSGYTSEGRHENGSRISSIE